jgi:hypothetical protein
MPYPLRSEAALFSRPAPAANGPIQDEERVPLAQCDGEAHLDQGARTKRR